MAIVKDTEKLYDDVLRELICFSGKHGLYIIKPKKQEVLKAICRKLGYDYKSEIAYIGKGGKTKNSDLYRRSKQEMGWSNFEGATFVKKIGRYLDFDVRDKTNKKLQEAVRLFICSNFTIECAGFCYDTNLLDKETEYINLLQPCLNEKKNKKIKKKR